MTDCTLQELMGKLEKAEDDLRLLKSQVLELAKDKKQPVQKRIVIEENRCMTGARKLLRKLQAMEVNVPSQEVKQKYQATILEATGIVDSFIKEYEQGKVEVPFLLEMRGERFAEHWFYSNMSFTSPFFDVRTAWTKKEGGGALEMVRMRIQLLSVS